MISLTPGSTLITDLSDAVATRCGALSVDGDSLNAYAYEPGYEGMALPAATLFIPDGERPPISASEATMGADDWDLTWTLRLYIDLYDAATAQRQIVVLLTDAILAFDNEPTLGGLVLDCRITRWTSGVVHAENRERPLMTYECELSARMLVDTLY